MLEEHWNGTWLNSIHNAIEWTKSMTWNGLHPVVHLIKKMYKKEVMLTDDETTPYEATRQRSATFPKWDVTIQPVLG